MKKETSFPFQFQEQLTTLFLLVSLSFKETPMSMDLRLQMENLFEFSKMPPRIEKKVLEKEEDLAKTHEQEHQVLCQRLQDL